MNDDEDNPVDLNLFNEQILQLSEKIQKVNPPVGSFLDEKLVLPALRCRPTGIKEYEKSHLLELLSVCLSPDLSLQTIRAFYAFCFNDNPFSYKPILDNKFFPSVVDVILQNIIQKSNQNVELNDAEIALLGRISTIAYNCLFLCPKESMRAIDFIPQLLDYVYISSVASTFEKLFSNASKLEPIQDWLTQEIKIGDLIANKIIKNYMNYPIQKNNQEPSNDEAFIINRIDDRSLNTAILYRLISFGCMGLITRSHFRSDLAISAVCQSNPNDVQKIRDLRWAAAVSICHSSTAKRLLPLIDMALAVLYKPLTKLTNEVVSCLNFITLMLKYLSVETANVLIQPSSQIFSIIMRILLQFPSSSIIHYSFRHFVLSCVSNALLMPKVIESYVPLLLAEVQNRNEILWKTKKTESLAQNTESNETSETNETPLKKIRENGQNGILYATYWHILIKIYELSSYPTRSTQFFVSPSKTSTQTDDKNLKASASSPSFLSIFSPKRFRKKNQSEENLIQEKPVQESPQKIRPQKIAVKAASIRIELDKIVEFDAFVKTELQDYLKLLNSPYGGPVPMTSPPPY